MDREAFERDLARRLLNHVRNHTTDFSDEVYEVPAYEYTARDHYEQELQVLFRDHPLVLCLSGAVPRPGSYWTADLAGIPVIVTRDGDGKVHAFANTCSHRGARVVQGAGSARRFTCPFHGWVYDLEGKLVGVPVAEAFEGMCRESKGLVELPVAEGYGLIVGRLSLGAPVDLDAYLGPGLTDELATLDFAAWEPDKEAHTHKIGANWKVTLDTFRENYHFNTLHKETLAEFAHGGVLTFDAFGPHLRNATCYLSIDRFLDLPEDEWEDIGEHFSYQYQLFPNATLTLDVWHIDLWQILPVDESHSEVLHTVYLRPGLSDEEKAKATDMIPWICQTVVDGQDFWAASLTEPSLRTGMLKNVVLGRNELALAHLHRGYRAALAAAREKQSPD